MMFNPHTPQSSTALSIYEQKMLAAARIVLCDHDSQPVKNPDVVLMKEGKETAEIYATDLILAIKYGALGLVSFLLYARDDIRECTSAGQTVLMAAIQYARFNLLFVLLKAGAVTIINDKDQYGRTALTLAVERGCVHTVQTLLEAGATPSYEALLLAAERGSFAIVKCLLDAGADVHACRAPGETVLRYLMVKRCFQYNMDAKVFDNAAEDNNILSILVEHGAMSELDSSDSLKSLVSLVGQREQLESKYYAVTSTEDKIITVVYTQIKFARHFQMLKDYLAPIHQKFLDSKVMQHQAAFFSDELSSMPFVSGKLGMMLTEVISERFPCFLILQYAWVRGERSDDVEALARDAQDIEQANRRRAICEAAKEEPEVLDVCDTCAPRP